MRPQLHNAKREHSHTIPARYSKISNKIRETFRNMKISRSYSFALYYLAPGEALETKNLWYCDTFASMRDMEARVIENFEGDPNLRGSYVATIGSRWLTIYTKKDSKITSSQI